MAALTDRRGRMSGVVELDSDAVGPDSLKAAFDVAVDALLLRASRHGKGLDWNTLEMALSTSVEETLVVVRAQVLT